MLARAVTFCLSGVEARRIEVEAKAGRGLPSFTVVGLPDRAVQEARERVRGRARLERVRSSLKAA